MGLLGFFQKEKALSEREIKKMMKENPVVKIGPLTYELYQETRYTDRWHAMGSEDYSVKEPYTHYGWKVTCHDKENLLTDVHMEDSIKGVKVDKANDCFKDCYNLVSVEHISTNVLNNNDNQHMFAKSGLRYIPQQILDDPYDMNFMQDAYNLDNYQECISYIKEHFYGQYPREKYINDLQQTIFSSQEKLNALENEKAKNEILPTHDEYQLVSFLLVQKYGKTINVELLCGKENGAWKIICDENARKNGRGSMSGSMDSKSEINAYDYSSFLDIYCPGEHQNLCITPLSQKEGIERLLEMYDRSIERTTRVFEKSASELKKCISDTREKSNAVQEKLGCKRENKEEIINQQTRENKDDIAL